MKKENFSKEYNSLAKYYDYLYNEKDYLDEAIFFTKLIKKYKKSKGKKLLDIACGTGNHIKYFKQYFKPTGIDLSKELIIIARNKISDVDFKVADMTKFKSLEKFDAITCLFSSISYIKSSEGLKKTVNNFYNNLKTGGVLLIETAFLKNKLPEIKNHIRYYKNKNLTLKRTLNVFIKSDNAIIKARYEITENGKVKKIIDDKHILQLHDEKKLISLMKEVGFSVKTFIYKKIGTQIFLGVKQQ